jgi:hypothetical protein
MNMRKLRGALTAFIFGSLMVAGCGGPIDDPSHLGGAREQSAGLRLPIPCDSFLTMCTERAGATEKSCNAMPVAEGSMTAKCTVLHVEAIQKCQDTFYKFCS